MMTDQVVILPEMSVRFFLSKLSQRLQALQNYDQWMHLFCININWKIKNKLWGYLLEEIVLRISNILMLIELNNKKSVDPCSRNLGRKLV